MFQFQFDEEKDEVVAKLPPTEKLSEEFAVGDKIRCDKHSAVIKYIGPVSPHAGVWLGVEWEDPTRGKHNGTVEGIEYFRSRQENAASFIRPHKAKRCIDIFTALRERYGHDERVMSRIKLVDENRTPRRVRYEDLKVLDLCEKEISELGEPGELTKLCPKVEFLNLAENLLSSWDSIVDICKSFHHLKGLDLSGNPLVTTTKNYPAVFPGLEHVILGNVKYNWLDVLAVSVLWPNLKNLQVPFNAIFRIVPPINSLLNLTSLDLESNQLTSWDEVIKLNVCQSLEYLNLCGNRLSNIRFPLKPNAEKNDQTTQLFQHLKRLNLTQNLIEDWISVTELSKLQGLVELRIELNPVFDKDNKVNNRQMVIARMPKLSKLEGIEIDRSERRDAEIDYVKKYAEKWRNEGTELRFAAEHPRYVELVQRFGESEVGELIRPIKTLQSSVITLQLCPQEPNMKSCARKVVPNMTVSKLKMLIQRIFKMQTPITYIGIVSSQNSGITFKLANDAYDLSQYSVEDGDKVIVRWT